MSAPASDPTAPVVQVTAAASGDVLVTMTRIEAKVDVALATFGVQQKAHGEGLDDHESRLRAVETKVAAMWVMHGLGVAGIAALITYVINNV